MSVVVNSLTKKYADQVAVDKLSFEAQPGQILGFLGPNGAGKSTTLKIISGYLEPSSGQVEVCGNDVLQDPIGCRSNIGYLPENNPLYLEMYVHEYLGFIGGLHKLRGSRLRSRVKEMVGLCGLGPEQNKLIGALSKGYRQRVGLAQALLNDPPVLILDEPTSGLDPNQIVEIRSLIAEVSQEKTVIFSSHILSEVQAICHRVLILNRGEMVLDQPTAQLKTNLTDSKRLIVEFAQPVPESELLDINGVKGVEAMGEGKYSLEVDSKDDIRPAVFKFASQQNRTLVELREQEGSLEEIFHQLTK